MTKKKETPEARVADTILQEPVRVRIGRKSYDVAPPSIATLIRMSERVAELPAVQTATRDAIGEALRVAKDCGPIGAIMAIAVLGAKRVRRGRYGLRALLGLGTEADRLATALLEEKTPQQISELLVEILAKRMEVGFFLGITTSLSAVNMIRPTQSETIASGPR